MIALENVNLAYTAGESSVSVLNGASLDVAQGESVAIVGPSGSGKTSLLLVLTGLETPDSGSVTFDGASLHTSPNAERADIRRGWNHLQLAGVRGLGLLCGSENVPMTMDSSRDTASRKQAA